MNLSEVSNQVKDALDVIAEGHGFKYVLVLQSTDAKDQRHGEALFTTESRTIVRSNLQTYEGVKLLQNALARSPIPQG